MQTGFLKFGSLLLALGFMLPVAEAQSLTGGPFADRAAQLKEFQGNISVLKDNNPWALNANDWVQVNQTIVTLADGYGKFQVNDGSTFEVFPNSRVVFRKNSSMMDLLDLMLGKVKVHIQRGLGGQPNPNNVRTPTAIISVRGTTFEVKADVDLTQVDVEEGHVEVRHRPMDRLPDNLKPLSEIGPIVGEQALEFIEQTHRRLVQARRRLVKADCRPPAALILILLDGRLRGMRRGSRAETC